MHSSSKRHQKFIKPHTKKISFRRSHSRSIIKLNFKNPLRMAFVTIQTDPFLQCSSIAQFKLHDTNLKLSDPCWKKKKLSEYVHLFA